jgi:hypothetical protein
VNAAFLISASLLRARGAKIQHFSFVSLSSVKLIARDVTDASAPLRDLRICHQVRFKSTHPQVRHSLWSDCQYGGMCVLTGVLVSCLSGTCLVCGALRY